MNCDLCGRETELYRAVVEGTELTVCDNCGKYGKVIGKVKNPMEEKKKHEQMIRPREELIETIVPEFNRIIKMKREQLGMKQEEFAKKVAEKESIVHKLETGNLVPSLELARKLEKMLGIKLITEIREEPVHQEISKKEMTLGDMINIKKG